MAYFGENWDDAEWPLAYLITIRTYGTWLHGDDRSSVDTHGRFNIYGEPGRQPNANLQKVMLKNMAADAVKFNKDQRQVVDEAIREVCKNRGYSLYALNVRTNHGHAVVYALTKPEFMANSFKSYATRKLRERNLFPDDLSPWSRGRSRRYLWKNNHVGAAIDYVLYCQGDDFLLDFDDWYKKRYDD